MTRDLFVDPRLPAKHYPPNKGGNWTMGFTVADRAFARISRHVRRQWSAAANAR